mmetsp:Transcript_72862/g.204656  ORF Transcript_72862/g.204656 Transcript_72862/m.204656 type:complete len:347 (+) Transcript_72862:1233-2273(+)
MLRDHQAQHLLRILDGAPDVCPDRSLLALLEQVKSCHSHDILGAVEGLAGEQAQAHQVEAVCAGVEDVETENPYAKRLREDARQLLDLRGNVPQRVHISKVHWLLVQLTLLRRAAHEVCRVVLDVARVAVEAAAHLCRDGLQLIGRHGTRHVWEARPLKGEHVQVDDVDVVQRGAVTNEAVYHQAPADLTTHCIEARRAEGDKTSEVIVPARPCDAREIVDSLRGAVLLHAEHLPASLGNGVKVLAALQKALGLERGVVLVGGDGGKGLNPIYPGIALRLYDRARQAGEDQVRLRAFLCVRAAGLETQRHVRRLLERGVTPLFKEVQAPCSRSAPLEALPALLELL